MNMVLEDSYLLLGDKNLSNVREILPLLEAVAKSGKPMRGIAEDVGREVIATLVVNALRGTIKVAEVKAPGYGDRRKAMLEDIAILTGGQVIADEVGLNREKANHEHLGTAKKIVVTKENTTIVGGV